jgi:predicted O-linked N-acetylglucosamine transferase (SPINDLY family)
MTSLMQNFAKAKQNRIAELQAWQQAQSQAKTVRRQEVETRAITVRSQLAENQQQRLAQAAVDRNTRIQQDQNRLAIATVDRAIRLQDLANRANDMRSLLAKIHSDRLVMSAIPPQEPSDYTKYTDNYVWSIEAETMDLINQPMVVISLDSAIATPINQVRTSPTTEFIQAYVSKLEGNPTLVQVVNDRDRVRELLSTGANSLKIDPSEILNTLLKLVDLEN